MKEKLNEIKQWIVKGDHDLGTARITYLHIPEFLDTVTFHCQQSIEKYLKAYLIFLSTPFRHSHDLVYLLELILQKDAGVEEFLEGISELQGYAVEIRYPDETIFLTAEKVEKAIETAKTIRSMVLGKMNITIDYNKIIDQ